MTAISRDPVEAAGRTYDLIIVGGGIYGAMLALEATRRGQHPLLLERSDFGGATSWNSLRVLHGGLRYLQTLDLRRFRESVAERRWFLRHFPELTRPLACLMPLFGDGLRRPIVLRTALALNDRLAGKRNVGVPESRRLPAGGVLDPAQTIDLYPEVRREGLVGSARWYDATADTPRVLIEVLKWAADLGATCLNYVAVTGLRESGGKVAGVEAVDTETGRELEYRSRVVVNAAGPLCRQLAASVDRDLPDLFRPSLAFNLLLDRPAPSSCALAVSSPHQPQRAYFLYPWKEHLLAGTHHAPFDGDLERPSPPEALVEEFLADLSQAVPSLSLDHDAVLRILSGLLPAREGGTARLAVREVVHDHGRAGGPAGLYSVSGVKWTTARRVAEKTLDKVLTYSAGARSREGGRPSTSGPPPEWADFETMLANRPNEATDVVRSLIREEAVVKLEDLLLRRTGWGWDPRQLVAAGQKVADLMAWSEERKRAEIEPLRELTYT